MSTKKCIFDKCLELLIMCVMILCSAVGIPDDSIDFQKTLPVQVIWAVEGKDVELPCDVTPPTPKDSVSMILWFKDSIGIPLYSLDARGADLSEAHHLAVTNNEIGSRSYFLTGSEPSQARLRIHGVRDSDEGIFRCRVDFSDSPTRNYKVNLTLVVQPSEPRIFDAQGHELLHSTAGPFLQGHELFLSCQVYGGRPRPTVTWWQNGSLVDSVVDSTRDARTTVNQLLIARITRQMWGSQLECRASSHDAAGYKSKEVQLVIFLMPQKVKISAPTELMSTRMPQLCRCETSGSYPPAKIIWMLGNKLIRNSSVTVSQTEDSTTSVLTLLPSPEDDGKELICRADNPRFPGGNMQDSRTVRVAYPPKAVVHFQAGSGVTVVDGNETIPILKEGGYVKLICKTVAVPPAFKYTWYHNGHLVEYNETAGTLPSDHVLELKNLDRSSQGEYACAAGNDEGETLSEPLRLQIQYAPRCREGHEILHIGAVPHEPLLVKCHVDASPSLVKFSWTYNNSRDVLPVQPASMNNNGVISQLHFTPGDNSGQGLGTLACWASNTVGKQRKPCLFHLQPANLPESPRDCSIRKPCDLCVEVICEAGEDGGLAQSFILEVNDVSPSVSISGAGSTTLSDQAKVPPVMRLQQPEPVFRVHALDPGKEYQLAVYAQNARGRSEPPVQLANVRVTRNQATPDMVNEKPSGSSSSTQDDSLTSPAQHSLALILGALTAGACAVIVGVIAITIIILRRRRTPRPSPATPRRHHDDNKSDTVLELRDRDAGFGEGFQRRSLEWRERNLRTSMFLQDSEAPASGRASQHISIGPDLILSPVNFALARPRYDEEYLSFAGGDALLHHPPSGAYTSYATEMNYEG